jgi:hypothetical protein
MNMKNPLSGASMLYDIISILEIYNPQMQQDIMWFKRLQMAIKRWHNEIVITNRTLGINNDNEYDIRIFEEAIMEKFHLSEKPAADITITTNFELLVSLVELGARRFGH